MDSPSADPEQLRRSLKFIRQINFLLGYTRSTLFHLDQLSRDWDREKTIRILDVATGSADIPYAILSWATRRGFDVQITALDLHAETIETAAREAKSHGGSRLIFVRGDATRLPFADDSFDCAITNMFLHHLDEEAVIQVLSELSRVSRADILAADLIRSRRAYAWITLFTALANPMVRHDARVSVAQAFSPAEMMSLANRAGLKRAEFHRHFGHRFVLSSRKSPSISE